MSRLTRDGTAEPFSRDQILRRERGRGNIHFPCSVDHEQDWQPYSVDPYSCYMCDHKCNGGLLPDTSIYTQYESLEKPNQANRRYFCAPSRQTQSNPTSREIPPIFTAPLCKQGSKVLRFLLFLGVDVQSKVFGCIIRHCIILNMYVYKYSRSYHYPLHPSGDNHLVYTFLQDKKLLRILGRTPAVQQAIHHYSYPRARKRSTTVNDTVKGAL